MASIVRVLSVPSPADAPELRERARGSLLGLAVGDALGAPAENLKPSEIRARWGRITGYVADRPCGTDDTEYAIFSGLLLARHGCALTPADAEAAWHEWIANGHEGPFRGAGFSERGTLENLRRGLAAPISAQHRHAWSDGLAMRAAPFGVFAAGRPAEAARLVAIDGSVSHDGEGIYGGQAVAAGVAAAMAGAPPGAVVAAALAVVPDDSWTARSLRRAAAVAHRGERAVRSAVVVGGYPWTDLAPEAVALAFGAYACADGDFRRAVLTAVNMGRDADTTAAVAGALAGATEGMRAIPPDWAAAIGPARGSCLPSMAGHHVLDVADLLVQDCDGPKTDDPDPARIGRAPAMDGYEPVQGRYEPDRNRREPEGTYEPGQGRREPVQGTYEPSQGRREPVQDTYATVRKTYDSDQDARTTAVTQRGAVFAGASAVLRGCAEVAGPEEHARHALLPDSVRGTARPAAQTADTAVADTAACVPAAGTSVEQGEVLP
jgi:ADP-ribosylglycohydrolase